MLYNGEQIGDGSPPEVDVAVDPLEGTRLTARGQPSALAVVALAERGSMFDPGPCVYMEKIAGGPDIADLLDLDRPLGETLKLVAKRRGSDVSDLMVIMLDRERHDEASRRSASAARASASSPTATCRPRCWRSPRAPASTCCGGSAARRRACCRRPRSRAWAASCVGRLWPRDDDERRRADRRRLRPRRGARRRPARVRRRRLLRRHRRHRRRPAAGRALPRRRRGDDRVARDALALRHGAQGAGDAQPRRSCAS